MKKVKYKILFRVLFFTLTVLALSCTKLDNKNYNEYLTTQFTPDPANIAAFTAVAYSQWDAIFLQWNTVWRCEEVGADEVVIPARPNGWVDGGIYKRMHQHNFSADDGTSISPWVNTYAGVSACNRIINGITSGTIPLTTTKQTVLAELKVARAAYYYILCDIYGNVPIDTSYLPGTSYIPPQKTRKEVYNFIIQEITNNLPYLSRDHNGITYGRFNVWAARTLLAKMYLNAEVYSGTADWQNCITQCDSVIANGTYALEADQKNVFITENQDSKEIIFAIPIDATYTINWNTNDIHMQTLEPENQATYGLTQTPWGGECAIPQFINTFDTTDSRFTKNFITGPQYAKDGTPLKVAAGTKAFVGKPLAYINEVPSVDLSEEVHGFRFGKFEIATGSSNILNNDWPLFRYADILLMKAECLLRTGHADDAAVLVTTVRNRAFKTNPSKATVTGADLQSGSSYDYGMRDNETTPTHEGGSDIVNGRFLDELGWEFNQEGRRRQDMIRFGVYTSKSWFSHTASNTNKILYPIPTSALNTNSTIKQNPGY